MVSVRAVESFVDETVLLPGPEYSGPWRIKLSSESFEHSCDMSSMNDSDDVPAREAEGRITFNAEKTSQ